jgi:magnesium transporter
VEVTGQFIQQLQRFIKAKNEEKILELIADMHPTDLAIVFEQISPKEALELFTFIDQEKAADVITELDEEAREKFLAQLSSKEIAARFVENLDSDDAADILSEFSKEKQREILSEIEDPDVASDIVDLLQYDENTAGGLMAKELIKVQVNWSREKIIEELRLQAAEIENVYAVYVVDEHDKLLGILPLKKLLVEPESVPIEDIYLDKIVYAEVNSPIAEVAQQMKKYDLVALPVVDALGRLVGRITIDDAVDVIQDEADRDYQLLSGLSEDVEADDSIWILSRARIPWLLVGLLGGIVGANIISQYEEQIMIHPEMAYFIPLIAAMGGNAGVQSSAIVVQGLANRSFRNGAFITKLGKELTVGLMNGLVCAVCIFAYNYFFGGNIQLAFTVGIAMLTVIMSASVLGTFIPLSLNKIKIDPALATGPFITTMNDITGMFIYFLIGRLMYSLII